MEAPEEKPLTGGHGAADLEGTSRTDGRLTAGKHPRAKWMVLGSVVRAMNRFKKSLNPEVDFRTNMETKRVSTGSEEFPALSPGLSVDRSSLRRGATVQGSGEFNLSSEDKRRRMLGGPSQHHGKKMAILLGK